MAVVVRDWVSDLAEFPEIAIETAFRDWRQMETKKPTIADIRWRCQRRVKRQREILRRIRVVTTLEPREPSAEAQAALDRLGVGGCARASGDGARTSPHEAGGAFRRRPTAGDVIVTPEEAQANAAKWAAELGVDLGNPEVQNSGYAPGSQPRGATP